MQNLRSIAFLPLLLAASCAGGGGGENDATAGGGGAPASDNDFKPLSQRINDISSGNNGSYKRDGEGKWTATSSKRSSFETSRESAYFNGEYGKKDYKTKDYARKSWWGDTSYQTKSYEGDTDGSRFQTSSKYQGKGALEAGTASNFSGDYQTGGYQTGTAREAGKGNIAKPSDAETDVRRRVYKQPPVVNYWGEQRNMSVEETKGLLGR